MTARSSGVESHRHAVAPRRYVRHVASRRGAPVISSQVHYMRGGKPGYYPPIKGKGGPGGHFLLNLWDVLGNVEKMSPEKKERGLKVEILNGRPAASAASTFAVYLGDARFFDGVPVASRRPTPSTDGIDRAIMVPFDCYRAGHDGMGLSPGRRSRARSPF